MTKLYIAFGSNLSKKQMRFRCPNARPLGKFMLTSAQLVFRGVADLEFKDGAETPCGLWAIQKSDEDALDRYEGISGGAYFKSEKITLQWKGHPRRALIYLMNSEAIYPPSQSYVDTIRKGYKDFDLKESYLDDAIERSFKDKAPDQGVLARRARQRSTREHRELVALPGSLKKLVKTPLPELELMPAPAETTLPELTPERRYEPDEPTLMEVDDPKFGDGDGGWYFDSAYGGWRIVGGKSA